MSLATTVSLQLPDGWIELDPREPSLVESLAAAIDIRADARQQALALLAPLAVALGRLAAESHVILVGLFARAVPVDGGEPLILTGHVTLAVSPAVSGLGEVHVASAAGAVASVELRAGAGVLRTEVITLTDPSWDEPVPARLRQYFVPIPGSDRLAALTFLTPNLDLADQFDEVFQAIAETLEFGYDDEPVTSAT